MEFKEIEKAVLDWLATKVSDPELIKQLKNALPKDREQTDEGIFLDLALPADLKSSKITQTLGNPLHGPSVSSSSLKGNAKSLIFISEGQVAVLEIFSNEEIFPKQFEDFKLLEVI